MIKQKFALNININCYPHNKTSQILILLKIKIWKYKIKTYFPSNNIKSKINLLYLMMQILIKYYKKFIQNVTRLIQ